MVFGILMAGLVGGATAYLLNPPTVKAGKKKKEEDNDKQEKAKTSS